MGGVIPAPHAGPEAARGEQARLGEVGAAVEDGPEGACRRWPGSSRIHGRRLGLTSRAASPGPAPVDGRRQPGGKRKVDAMGDEEDEAAVKGALSWPYELYIHGGAIALAAEDAVRQVGFAPETEDVHVTVLYFGEACCTSGRLVRIQKVLDRLWYEYMNEQRGMDFFLTPWGECSLRVRGPLEQLILRLREEYPSDVEQRPPHVAVANRRGTENRQTDAHRQLQMVAARHRRRD